MGDRSWYAASHSGKLSLLLSRELEMSTGHWAVTLLCSLESNHWPEVSPALRYRLCGRLIDRLK